RGVHLRASYRIELPRACCCGALATRRICSAVRFRIDFKSWSKRELSCHHDCFVRLNTTFHDHEIAILPLSGFNWTKVYGVIRFHHKNKRSTLTNLHSLRWNEPRILDCVENETNPHEFRRPKRVDRIWRH